MSMEAGERIVLEDLKKFLGGFCAFEAFLELNQATEDKKLDSISNMLRGSPAYVLEDGGSFFWNEDPSHDWRAIHQQWYQLCKESEHVFDGHLPEDREVISVRKRGETAVKDLVFVAMTNDMRYLCYDDDNELTATAYDYLVDKEDLA